MKIKVDDLTGPEIAELLEQHINEMRAISPPESKHALDLDGLRKPEITFWTIWDGESLAGCGALKELDPSHGEIKSMRTAPEYRKNGIATMILQHIIDEAKRRNYQRLSLETGSMPFFEPARQLYLKFGFVYCEPFADYKEDPNSRFMTKEL
ncbi:MAG TPA: GNAT family N-acetyltransferase [Blastocatellia bacterium]|nr:GNAT family N-acetyltransferase [Blastocatellia bacterium]